MKTDSEWKTDFLALIILCFILLIVVANAAFIAGYLQGINRALEDRANLEDRATLEPPKSLMVRERLDQIPTEFGPLYNKPQIESRGRIGW